MLLAETDGPSKLEKQVSKTGSEAASDEKYKDRGNQSPKGKLERNTAGSLPSPLSITNPPSVTSPAAVFSPSSAMSPRRINRKLSSPLAPEIMLPRRSLSPEAEGRARPLSFSFFENESSGSRSVTPQHRKLLANMASSGSSKQDRPRVRRRREGGQKAAGYSSPPDTRRGGVN